MHVHPVSASLPFWSVRREAALNWLALGLLLAAWNMADNGGDAGDRRPAPLRGYVQVSVRAAQRAVAIEP